MTNLEATMDTAADRKLEQEARATEVTTRKETASKFSVRGAAASHMHYSN